MENIRQNFLAAQINCLRSLDFNSERTLETVDPQLRIIQMNWMFYKFYQDQLKLIQQLQLDQQKLLGDVAPASSLGLSIADEQHQQHQATECPIDLPPEFSAEEADHREESMQLQENLPKVSTLQGRGEISLGQAPMRVADPVKAAHGPAATRMKLRFHPYEFRQSVHGPNIAALQLTGPVEVDVKYHKSMVRSFDNKGKECTPRQRERR
uniref:Uncharacterized protein n=1 Tax=Anopheles atroparvus TaxID=41427 RepID=A0A182J0L8_ANOAO